LCRRFYAWQQPYDNSWCSHRFVRRYPVLHHVQGLLRLWQLLSMSRNVLPCSESEVSLPSEVWGCGSSVAESPGVLECDTVLLVVYVIKCGKCLVSSQHHSTTTQKAWARWIQCTYLHYIFSLVLYCHYSSPKFYLPLRYS
jgi:hypothetical protein